MAELAVLAVITADFASAPDRRRVIARVIVASSIGTVALGVLGLILFYARVPSGLIGAYGDLHALAPLCPDSGRVRKSEPACQLLHLRVGNRRKPRCCAASAAAYGDPGQPRTTVRGYILAGRDRFPVRGRDATVCRSPRPATLDHPGRGGGG